MGSDGVLGRTLVQVGHHFAPPPLWGCFAPQRGRTKSSLASQRGRDVVQPAGMGRTKSSLAIPQNFVQAKQGLGRVPVKQWQRGGADPTLPTTPWLAKDRLGTAPRRARKGFCFWAKPNPRRGCKALPLRLLRWGFASRSGPRTSTPALPLRGGPPTPGAQSKGGLFLH
jgi:hypothetical protein